MAQGQNNNPMQAWANFAETGSISDYLRYRALENRAEQVSGSRSQVSGGDHAKRGTHPTKHGAEGKRPPGYGAF